MTMSYSLRVREDGQTEVLEHQAVVIGTFARPEHARHFYDWMTGSHLTVRKAPEPEIEAIGRLQAAIEELGEARPPVVPGKTDIQFLGKTRPTAPEAKAPAARHDRQAERDVSVPVAVKDDDVHAPEAPPAATLPALADKPRQAVTMCADLPAEVMAAAFERLERGEGLQVVAADLGVPWPSLRGAYAGYKGRRQREIARGGMSTCSLCSKEFMPSVTSPDTCARCTRTMER